jgi:hypothetical protein
MPELGQHCRHQDSNDRQRRRQLRASQQLSNMRFHDTSTAQAAAI